jgi:hypothetical protein
MKLCLFGERQLNGTERRCLRSVHKIPLLKK